MKQDLYTFNKSKFLLVLGDDISKFDIRNNISIDQDKIRLDDRFSINISQGIPNRKTVFANNDFDITVRIVHPFWLSGKKKKDNFYTKQEGAFDKTGLSKSHTVVLALWNTLFL